MLSLDKIARALGSSHLELISGAADRVRTPVTSSPRLLRSDEGETGPFGEGESRLLAYGERAFHPMRFEGTNTSGGEYHAHDEDEFLHVIEGSCTVELREHGRFELALGDSLYFDGGTPHRWFSRDGSRYRLFIVKQHFAMRDLDSVWGPALLVDYEESE